MLSPSRSFTILWPENCLWVYNLKMDVTIRIYFWWTKVLLLYRQTQISWKWRIQNQILLWLFWNWNWNWYIYRWIQIPEYSVNLLQASYKEVKKYFPFDTAYTYTTGGINMNEYHVDVIDDEMLDQYVLKENKFHG